MQNRPNFLIISAEQHRADCFSISGCHVKTPNLSSLAYSGTRFGSCITPSVARQSARQAILTGQLYQTHGAQDGGRDLDQAIAEKGLAGTLSENGYQTSLFGKADFSDNLPEKPGGKPECAESSQQNSDDWTGPYMGFDHVEIALSTGNNTMPVEPPKGQHYERYFYADGQRKASAQQAGSYVKTDIPPYLHSTAWTADRAIDWLRHARQEQKPFCSWVSFANSHHPFDCPKPWSLLHASEAVDLPDNRVLHKASLPPWYQSAYEDEILAVDRINKELSMGQKDEMLKAMVTNAYGKIAFIDEQIGRLMHTLSELEIAQNTHVIYLSERGDWLGDHGFTFQPPLFYDSMLRVPLIWKGPDIPKNRVIYEPVSTLDLAPSLLSLAEATPQLDQHGKCLQDLLDWKSTREFATSEWESSAEHENSHFSVRCVRTRTYRLSKDMISGSGELYDLLADPQEMRNLFDDPALKDIQMRLESYLNTRSQNYATSSLKAA